MNVVIALHIVEIDYTNWKGERMPRRIEPRRLYFGTSEHHRPLPEWLLDAWDLNKDALRTFSMKNIHSWKPIR